MPLTALIGREREIAELREFVLGGGTRLLTLTGAGGSGKTRLAQQLALDLYDELEDGARFISLAAMTAPQHLLQAIALDLGVREDASRPLAAVVAGTIRTQQLLLVLDNFEQLVEAAPDVGLLLSECPRLVIVTTSRVPLHIRGEQEYPVSPLALPSVQQVERVEDLAQCAAVALFVERARAVDTAFVLDSGNAQTVAEICQRLDGLPLAIELAAARMKVLSAEGLLARLANRLRVLVDGARDLPARQRTLRDTIGWSYDLLAPGEQALFRALSVFSGGFTLDAAAAVTGDEDVLDGVTSLVDKSLLRRADVAGSLRFMMLETIREFASERLLESGGADDVQRAHAVWYAALADQGRSGVVSSAQYVWLDRLEAEHENLRAGLSWAAEHRDCELFLRYTASLWMFWHTRGYFSEGRNWLMRAIDSCSDSPTPNLAQSLGGAATMSGLTGDAEAGLRLGAESVRIAQLSGDQMSIGIAQFCFGDVNEELGDKSVALEAYLKAAGIFRALDEWVLLALVLANAGAVSVSLLRYAEATPHLEAALALSTAHGFDWGVGMCAANLARIELAEGDPGAAREHALQSLRVWLALGDRLRIVRMLERIATIAAADGQAVLATRLLSAAEARFDSFGTHRTAGAVEAYELALATIEPQLSPEALSSAWEAGRVLSIGQAVDVALAFELQERSVARPESSARPLLSARERDVMQLLVAGYSDRQIAETLFISHRTAQGHVGNIFNKLGVNSRTAAATTAIRLGLVSDDGVPPPPL